MYPNQQNNYNIPEPFGIRDIRITNVVIPLHTLSEKLRFNQISTHHENNLKFPLNSDEMSNLIETILLKIPMPIFYFDVSNPFTWSSINGIKRLITINEFIVQNKFPLSSMKILNNLDGLYYSQLPDNYKRILYDTQIITYQIEAQTPIQLRELIFKKIRDMNDN